MIKNLITNTKEKAEKAIDETKEKVQKLTESANEFISNGNNQMKIITIVIVGVGLTMFMTNITNMFANIYNARHKKAPIIIQNIYPNNIKGE